MKILICGASGFVGRHLTTALQGAGHTVIRGIRKSRLPTDIAVDFTKDTSKAAWLPKLQDIDAVINAVGVLRDSAKQPMKLLLEQTPIALFSACQEAGVKRIVQISALGIDGGIDTPYFQFRRAPEAYLNETVRLYAPEGTEPVLSAAEGLSSDKKTNKFKFLILRPSVIYGEDGASAKMFRLQASLPVLTLPAGGKQTLQPVHIDDICAAVSNWLADDRAQSQTVSCVGLEATNMRGMLDSYRHQLKKANALHISIPSFLVALTAKVGDFIPASPLCSDTLKMLNAGNTGDPADFTRLLGRQPRSYRAFISGKPSDAS